MHKKKIRNMVMILVILLAGCIVGFVVTNPQNNPALVDPQPISDYVVPIEAIDERVLNTDIVLPVGELVVTQLRAAYEDGTMRLVIPRLELDTPIGGDTTLETLARVPGLYKYAQIPNYYNTNVSIAAHRDLPGYEFYYLDTVVEGDFLYLIYKEKLFQYAYRTTEVVERNNWDPIRVHYDSRITLTTCTPLGTSRQRMIVVGELVAVEDYHEDYVFE